MISKDGRLCVYCHHPTYIIITLAATRGLAAAAAAATLMTSPAAMTSRSCRQLDELLLGTLMRLVHAPF